MCAVLQLNGRQWVGLYGRFFPTGAVAIQENNTPFEAGKKKESLRSGRPRQCCFFSCFYPSQWTSFSKCSYWNQEERFQVRGRRRQQQQQQLRKVKNVEYHATSGSCVIVMMQFLPTGTPACVVWWCVFSLFYFFLLSWGSSLSLPCLQKYHLSGMKKKDWIA